MTSHTSVTSMSSNDNNSCWWNGSYTNDNTHFIYNDAEAILGGTFSMLLAVGGFIFNLLVICAVMYHRKTREQTLTPFIISLCSSDLIFSTATLPLFATRFFARDWIVGEFLCQLFPFFLHANYGVTLLNILNVTIIRCISVYFPRRDIYSQRRTTKMTIAFCWIFPVLLLFLPLAKLWGEFGLECGTKNCVILKTKDGKTLAGFLGIVGFFLPLITLIVCNIAIYIRVKKVQRDVGVGGGGSSFRGNSYEMQKGVSGNRTREEREARITRMMLIVFGCFLMCYLPLFIYLRVDKEKKYPLAHIMTYIINWAQVVINPTIYVVYHKRYRFAIRHLFRGLFKLNKGSAYTESSFTSNIRKGSLITASRKTSRVSLASRKMSGGNLNVRKVNLIASSPGTSRGNTLASCGSYNNKDDSEVSHCSMLVHTSVEQ